MVNGILWLLDNDLRGPFNMVSPYPVHNEQFAHALGHALHRPAIMRVPAAAIRLLMGESSVLVLGGQRALPKRLEEAGEHPPGSLGVYWISDFAPEAHLAKVGLPSELTLCLNLSPASPEQYAELLHVCPALRPLHVICQQ